MLRQDTAENHNPLLQQLRQHGLEPVVGHWASSPEEIFELVMVSGGLCITPASSILSTPPGQLVFRALPDFAMELELRLCWKDPPATPTLSVFTEYLNRAIDRHQLEISSPGASWTVLDGVQLFRVYG